MQKISDYVYRYLADVDVNIDDISIAYPEWTSHLKVFEKCSNGFKIMML